MIPPTRIEQLNNFQDAVQSPDGLDRLRALQAVEQALPSSQGLMGMPQVQAPMPMVPRQYGGEIGTGGLINVLDDGTQVFDNSQEGILNRSIHGGIMQGFTPSTSQPTSNIDTTSVEQTKIGPYNLSDYSNLDIPQTIKMESSPQTSFRSPSGKIPYDLYVPPAVTDYAQGYDMKDVPYLVANKMAQDAGADRFIYNEQWARTEDLPDDYDYGKFGTQVYKPSVLRPNVDYSSALQHGYHQGNLPAPNPNSIYAKAAQGLFQNPHTGAYEYHGKGTAQPLTNRRNVYGPENYMKRYGGQIISKQYGGEIGTGGLLDVLDDGTQVFDHTQEGIQNRALHGGMLEGWNQQTSTAPSSSTSSSFSGGPTAAGTLASGTTAPSSFTISTGQDKYGNTIGDLTGTQDYYDLNFAARDAGQDTFMYGDKLMQVDTGYLRGGGINPFISNKVNEDMIHNPHLYSNYMSGSPHTNNISATKRPDIFDTGFYKEAPYAPTGDFTQDVSGSYDSYYDANLAAKEAGSPAFMWGSKWAKTDPGLLPDYIGGMKPFISNAVPEHYANAGVHLPQAWANMSARDIAKAQPDAPIGLNWDDQGRRYRSGGYPGSKIYFSDGGQIMSREGGGQVDPSQAAEGLASFGRYGDNILVHMNPEELEGLASLGNLTYNPVTGLPEAFSFGKIFKSIRKLAPIALAIAAPYAFGVAGGTALQIGAASGAGSFLGNIIAGAKPKDALKQGLLSGLFAGGGAYLGGAASGFGDVASQTAGGTSAITSGGINQGGLNISNPAFQSSPLSVALKTTGDVGSIAGQNLAKSINQFGGNVSGASSASLAGSANRMIPQSNLVFKSSAIPKTYSQSIGSANQIGLGNANVASNIAGSGSFSPNVTNQITSFGGNQGANLASNVGQGPTSIFAKGGLSKENLSRMGSQIYDDYANPKGIAKLVAMDLSTPDYDVMYANEAREKEQQLRDAGYTVDTGFDGQTVIRDSSGVTLPRNLTASMILDRALGRAPRTNLVARTDYATAKEGGLISLKHGGEFSGMVPGQGHGMEDNVYMPIVEKEQGSQVGTLAVSPSEYVVDSYTMAALGNGNADAGAKVMDRVVKHVRKKAYGDTEQPNEISGLQALKPMMERV